MTLFKNRIFISLLLVPSILLLSKSYALEVDTHELINERIANTNIAGFSLGAYLKAHLGFEQGGNEIVNKKKVFEWIKLGGRYEDTPPSEFPYTRSFNHFHNPISNKGFKGLWKSSIIWGQLPKATQVVGGDYSWHDTRDYFYKALASRNKTDRERYFADTFRGLGQLMHLVEDSSVPAHTRDDGHPFGFHYEKWVQQNYDAYNKILNITPRPFDKSILNSINLSAPVPISNIIDTNRYAGSNLSVVYGGDIGISEFTNANFFSEDTIFKNYPHPKKENTTANLVEQYAKDGKLDNVWYIQGYTSERLAAYSYFNKWLLPDKWEYNLDGFVYEDYASQLIPRAVGYSAGLLNYFFRGEMDFTTCNTIANNGEEDMSGWFRLFYDNKYDKRKQVWGGFLNIGSKGRSKVISFDPPTDAKEQGKYLLVFRGKLGNEEDAVVGRSVNIKPERTFYFLGQETILNEFHGSYEESSFHKKIKHYIQSNDGTNPDSMTRVTIGIDDLYGYFFLDGGYSERYEKDLVHDIAALFSYEKALFQKKEVTYDAKNRETLSEDNTDVYCCWIQDEEEAVERPGEATLTIGNNDRQIIVESRKSLSTHTSKATTWFWKVLPSPHAGVTAKNISQEEVNGKQYSLDIMGNDHRCDDENVILFYKVREDDLSFVWSSNWAAGEVPVENLHEKDTITNTYHLWYKIGSLLWKVQLPAVLVERRERTSPSSLLVHEKSGQQIEGLSCQINDGNMEYSYLVLKYENGDVVFDKRIVGTINISDKNYPVGHRLESVFNYY